MSPLDLDDGTHPTSQRASFRLTLLAMALVVGCGGGDKETALESAERFDGEERQVASVVERYERAMRQRDAARICTEILPRASVPENCQGALRRFLRQPVYRRIELDVQRVDVRGDRASARVLITLARQPEADSYTLLKQRGQWRVDALGGRPGQ